MASGYTQNNNSGTVKEFFRSRDFYSWLAVGAAVSALAILANEVTPQKTFAATYTELGECLHGTPFDTELDAAPATSKVAFADRNSTNFDTLTITPDASTTYTPSHLTYDIHSRGLLQPALVPNAATAAFLRLSGCPTPEKP